MSQSRIGVQEQWTKWCKTTDQKQLDWVISYLVKKERLTPLNGMTHDHIADFYNGLAKENPDKALLLMKEMKAAWSQKKVRDKNNGRKGYSFVMGTGIKKMLEQLAQSSNTSINVALERMIQDIAQFTAQLQKDQREKIEDAKSSQERAKGVLVEKLKLHKQYSLVQTTKYKKEIELLREAVKKLSFERALKHAVLESYGLDDSESTKEQADNVLEVAEAYIAELNQSIKLETDKFRHIVKPRRIDAERS